MKRTDIREVERESLRDIQGVQIDTTLSCDERIRDFVTQIGNPYCYLDGDIVVGVRFKDTAITLQKRLEDYASSLM